MRNTCKITVRYIADFQYSFPSSQFPGLLLTISIGQGFTGFFCRGTDSEYFRFCGPGGKIEDINYILT